jgi:LacI family transcriptional regulator
MEFSTSRPRSVDRNTNIGLVLDTIMAQRLAKGMFRHFHPNRRFWFLDLYRPVQELCEVIRERQPAGLVTRHVAGITEELAKLGIPIVAYSSDLRHPAVRCIDVDNGAIGALAARHFLDQGLRSFAYVGTNYPYSVQRFDGYAGALRRAGFGCAHFSEPMRYWEHYLEYWQPQENKISRWLKSLPQPVGVFTAFDKIGWEVSDACRAAGLRVPEEVAVLGVNNDEFYCGLSHPPLSSIRIPWERVGAEAALMLEQQMARPRSGGDSTRQTRKAVVLVPPEGVATRQSTDLIAVPVPAIARALAYIRRHASEPINIKDVLKDLPVSRRNFELEFQRHLGRTPKEELTRVRMEQAKELLMHTDLQVTLVAERCGFNYAERFCVAFKRATGVTPMAFRRQFRLRA